MVDANISFDPKRLTEAETTALMNKIRDYSTPVDNSGCRNWTKSALKNGYPQMKLTVKVAFWSNLSVRLLI